MIHIIFFLTDNLSSTESTRMAENLVYPNARRDEGVVDDNHGIKVNEFIQNRSDNCSLARFDQKCQFETLPSKIAYVYPIAADETLSYFQLKKNQYFFVLNIDRRSISLDGRP